MDSKRLDSKRRQAILTAARRYVEKNKTTECVMEPGLGFQGPACPVVNCYMRCEKTGACLAKDQDAAKASNKAMRDVIAVVEVIEAAINAPDWVNDKTYPVHGSNIIVYNDFIKEANINPAKLQFVIDNNKVHAMTLANAFARAS